MDKVYIIGGLVQFIHKTMFEYNLDVGQLKKSCKFKEFNNQIKIDSIFYKK